jgi:lysophospholipase
MILDPRFHAPEGWQWRDNLETRSGQFIRIGWVAPARAKALVAIYPGLSEYGEKYFEVARDLVARNFAVACVDWRGQGKSWRHGHPDKRLHDDFQDDVADAHAYLKFIPVDAGLPRIMLAHSMGGHIGMRVLHDEPDTFKCAVMTAPLFGLNVPEIAAMGLARTMCAAGFGDAYLPAHGPWTRARLDTNLSLLTTDDARRDMQVYWMEKDPALRMGGLTMCWIRAALISIRLVRQPEYLRTVTTPILAIRSSREVVVSNADIAQVVGHLPNAQMITIDGALHEVMMERDSLRDQFWRAFDGFVAKQLGPR